MRVWDGEPVGREMRNVARLFVVFVLLVCPPFAHARRDTIAEAAMLILACLLAGFSFRYGVGLRTGRGTAVVMTRA